MNRHHACHRCPAMALRSPAAVCTVDGRDIIEHAEKGECPRGKYTEAVTCPPAPGKSPSTACVHRGAQTGEGQCSTCSGNVRVKLFACAVHQTCAIDRTPEGVRSCTGCADQRIADAP